MQDDINQPYFHISIVSEMLNLHPQTIRNYERMGLIRPARTDGRMRLFSRQDVERVRKINSYTNMGVNLAGVEIILKLLDQIENLQININTDMDDMQGVDSDELEEKIRKIRDAEEKKD